MIKNKKLKDKNIEEKYVRLEHRDQILLRPDTTIGSIVSDERNIYVVDDINDLNNIKIINKKINYNPGFFKIIDEILTNASDHFIRTQKVKYIKVNINDKSISIENDGPGIPVEIHKKEGVYLPEMLFGNIFTSENYDDNIERTWGGRNGIGAKATNIFSKRFIVETSDGFKKYIQEFHDNMDKKTKPKITKCKENYTKITFYPDFNRFGLDSIDEDMMSLIIRRCLDISVYCQGIKMYFNGKLIPVKNFKDYMKLFITDDSELFIDRLNDKWEIGLTKSIDGGFSHISMVNGLSTYKGGTHVNYITNQLTKKVQEILIKKYKNLNIKPNDIKNKIFIFINAKVVNPHFDEQSKETLTSKIDGFPDISDKFIKQFVNSHIIKELIDYLNVKEQIDVKKDVARSKVKINKLDDALKAGTSESNKCFIFITEGDSASASVSAGLSAVNNPQYYGSYPLRGKPLNVRDMDLSKLKDNDEIKNIINILGLEFGKKYTDTKKLRYGKVVLMADADCIDENTLILTKRGYLPIKNINYEDEVMSHKGKWKKVINILKTNKKNSIELTINNEKYIFGENHEIPVMRNNEIILVKAKDILKTDKMLKRKK